MEWLPRNRTEQALQVGRRIVSAYARRFSEHSSVNTHIEAIRTLDLLTRSEAERRAEIQRKHYPQYEDFLRTEIAEPVKPAPDQLTIHFEGLDNE